MTSLFSPAACRFCDRVHDIDLMCAPARRVLDALVERGTRFDMPTVEFGEPVENAAGMLGEGTVPVRQFVVQAAMVEVAGTRRPTLIFTGRDMNDTPLPQWIYPADIQGIRDARKLVCDMADLAIRTARNQPG